RVGLTLARAGEEAGTVQPVEILRERPTWSENDLLTVTACGYPRFGVRLCGGRANWRTVRREWTLEGKDYCAACIGRPRITPNIRTCCGVVDYPLLRRNHAYVVCHQPEERAR